MRLIPLQEFISTTPSIVAEHVNISVVLFQYINGLVQPIQDAATAYFRALSKKQAQEILPDGINLNAKKDGVQLGTIMNICYRLAMGGLELRTRYFIKTHQIGSTSGMGSVKPPDPKELLVYKALEYMGYRPKTHYFLIRFLPVAFILPLKT